MNSENGGILVNLAYLCGGVYPSYTNIKGQVNFIDK